MSPAQRATACREVLFFLMARLVRFSCEVPLLADKLRSASALAAGTATPKASPKWNATTKHPTRLQTEMAVSAELAAAIPMLRELCEYMSFIERSSIEIDEMEEFTNRERTPYEGLMFRMATTATCVTNEYRSMIRPLKSIIQILQNATYKTSKHGYGAVNAAKMVVPRIQGILEMRTKLMKSAADCSHATGMVCSGLTKTENVKMTSGDVMTAITYKTSLNVGGYGEVWEVSAEGPLSGQDLVMKLAIMVSVMSHFLFSGGIGTKLGTCPYKESFEYEWSLYILIRVATK
jgi:hypothetical protein